MLSNSCHGNHTKDFFTNLVFSETLEGISNTLQKLRLVQASADKIVGRGALDDPLGIKCGSEIAWYKKGYVLLRMQYKIFSGVKTKTHSNFQSSPI